MLDIEKMYKENFLAINKYLLCLTHNKDLSEELTQETFCKAVQKIHLYKSNYEISLWLCKIAKNLLYDYYRKNKKFINLPEKELQNFEDLNIIDDFIILQDEKNMLYKKLNSIDKKSQEVVYLRINGELSFKEIGILLGKSENWARVTYFRAKKKLKEVDFYEN